MASYVPRTVLSARDTNRRKKDSPCPETAYNLMGEGNAQKGVENGVKIFGGKGEEWWRSQSSLKVVHLGGNEMSVWSSFRWRLWSS